VRQVHYHCVTKLGSTVIYLNINICPSGSVYIRPITCLHCVYNFTVPKCLSPHQAELFVSNISHTDHSITLQLPDPERYPECENISLASVEYTVYYGQIKENGNVGCSTDMNFCSKLVSQYHNYHNISTSYFNPLRKQAMQKKIYIYILE